VHHSHADELIIEVLDGIRAGSIFGAELLDLGHRVLNPGNKGGQGLVLLLPNRKEVVPGIEVSSRTLLEVDGLKSGPNLCRVVLNSIYMGPLFSRQ